MQIQTAALESWKALGVPIVSLNAAEEFEAVRSAYPGTRIDRVNRSAAATLGKPLVMLDSVWDFARRCGHERLCLLNSDLFLRDADEFRRAIDRPFDLLFGSRLEVKQMGDTTGVAYEGGYDYFIMPAWRAAEFPSSSFCIGAPWWDYWVPMFAIQNGWTVCRRKDGAQGKSDYGDIFAFFFFSRMSNIRAIVQRGGAPRATIDQVADELTQSYAPAVVSFLRNPCTPV